MRTCPHCRKSMFSADTTCPHCQRTVPPQTKNWNMLIAAGVLLAVAMLVYAYWI
jgi:RNA polymerase subunit RPABC4/transcription elongation factor Spt4